MTTKTLPAVNEDPLIQAGRQAQADYDATVARLRSDPMLSGLARSEQINTAWETYHRDMNARATKFYEQRKAQLAALESTVPIGPDIPTDVSRADAAVLHQAFSAAFNTALNATPETLRTMLADAQRFGDDTTVRAVLTAASDKGHGGVITQWAAGDPQRLTAIKQAADLRDLLSGRGRDSAFARQAFGALRSQLPPSEVNSLPGLRHAAGVTP
jgi:hypothetical protein